MFDQRGVAPIAVIVIVVVSAGCTVGVPVAVDIADVDPDHPLYALERFGERIRMVSDEAQMMERWGEYAGLVERGKGFEYRHILEEFVEKVHKVAPGDVPAKPEVVKWMQEQLAGMGQVQLKLCKEMLEKCKERLPELEKELKEEIEAVERYEGLPSLPPETREEIRARLELIEQKLEKHRGKIPKPFIVYFDINEALAGVGIELNVETTISIEKPTDLAAKFNEVLDEFEKELAEIEAKLEGVAIELEIRPGVFKNLLETHGLHAVKRLVEVAKAHKEKAVAAFEADKLRKALCLIHAAKMQLKQAEKILEHAAEWEAEHREIWEKHFERFENLRGQFIEKYGKTWLENLEKLKETIAMEYEKAKEIAEEMYKKIAKEMAEKLSAYLENYMRAYEEYKIDYSAKLEELIACLTKGLHENASAKEIEPKLKGMQGLMWPYKIEVSGVLTEKSFEVTFADKGSISLPMGEHSYSLSGKATGEVSEGTITGSFSISATASTSVSAVGASGTIVCSAEASGSMTGTVQEGSVECDLKGEGSARIEGKFESDHGSASWVCTITFKVVGKLVGSSSDSVFTGTLCLRIEGVQVTEIKAEISPTVPTSPDVTPPEISALIDGKAVLELTTEKSPVVISGKVADDVSGPHEIVLKIYIGDKTIEVPLKSDDSFSQSVDLVEGKNTITLKAWDEAANLSELVLSVVYAPPPRP